MIKAVGYVRVSTDRQSLSLEAQQEKILAMATVKDATLVDMIVDEDESGKSLDRPGAKKLLAVVRSRPSGGGVGMVIIAKLDRLTRSVRDLSDIVDLLNRKDVSLVSVAETLDTSTAAGRMVMNIMATVGQWEREVIGERTSAALQQKRKRGERAGNIPYGFRLATDGKLEEEPAEQHITVTIRGYRQAGISLREIAASLNRQGYKTRAGTPWRFQYVANILEAK